MPRFRIGESVQQIVVPVKGTIVERTVVGDDDCYKVVWYDTGGEEHSRFFREDELETPV